MKPRLTKAQLVELFDPDKETGRLRWKLSCRHGRPGRLAGTVKPEGLIVAINGHQYGMGELIWCIANGDTPEHGIRHIDGNLMNWNLKNLKEKDPPPAVRVRSRDEGLAAIPFLVRRLEMLESRMRTILKRTETVRAELTSVMNSLSTQ